MQPFLVVLVPRLHTGIICSPVELENRQFSVMLKLDYPFWFLLKRLPSIGALQLRVRPKKQLAVWMICDSTCQDILILNLCNFALLCKDTPVDGTNWTTSWKSRIFLECCSKKICFCSGKSNHFVSSLNHFQNLIREKQKLIFLLVFVIVWIVFLFLFFLQENFLISIWWSFKKKIFLRMTNGF